MEGSKSEAVFESMDLNPQLFINETINSIEDYVDAAFDFYGRFVSPNLCRRRLGFIKAKGFLTKCFGFGAYIAVKHPNFSKSMDLIQSHKIYQT